MRLPCWFSMRHNKKIITTIQLAWIFFWIVCGRYSCNVKIILSNASVLKIESPPWSVFQVMRYINIEICRSRGSYYTLTLPVRDACVYRGASKFFGNDKGTTFVVYTIIRKVLAILGLGRVNNPPDLNFVIFDEVMHHSPWRYAVSIRLRSYTHINKEGAGRNLFGSSLCG